MNITQNYSNDEFERYYYSTGDTVKAAAYAALADSEAEREAIETELEQTYPADDYQKMEALVEHLREYIAAADKAVDALYGEIEDAPRVNKKRILAALAALNLDSDTQP